MSASPDDSGRELHVCRGLKANRPSSFAAGADVVLTDVDDYELAAHTAILAAQSQVLSDLFYSSDCTPSVHGEQGKLMWRVPVPDATFVQATGFVNYTYLQDEYRLSTEKVLSILGLLHRFDCSAALQKMDDYLTSGKTKPKPSVSPALKRPAAHAQGPGHSLSTHQCQSVHGEHQHQMSSPAQHSMHACRICKIRWRRSQR